MNRCSHPEMSENHLLCPTAIRGCFSRKTIDEHLTFPYDTPEIACLPPQSFTFGIFPWIPFAPNRSSRLVPFTTTSLLRLPPSSFSVAWRPPQPCLSPIPKRTIHDPILFPVVLSESCLTVLSHLLFLIRKYDAPCLPAASVARCNNLTSSNSRRPPRSRCPITSALR